jgi:hypothetical protein
MKSVEKCFLPQSRFGTLIEAQTTASTSVSQVLYAVILADGNLM